MNNRVQFLRLSAAFLISGLMACADTPRGPVEPLGPRVSTTGSDPAPTVMVMDEQWAQLAATDLPGFAGVVSVADGVDEVLVTNDAIAPRAQTYAQRLRTQSGAQVRNTRVRRVNFGFDQLMKWRVAILPSLGTNGMHYLDIDEVRNRIVIGVATIRDIAGARKLSASLGVPAAALDVEVVGRPQARLALADSAPTLYGGFEIYGGAGTCTHGFNTLTGGSTGDPAFITASHCSNTPWSTEGTFFNQGGRQIGVETNDPSLVGGYWSFGGRTGVCNYVCRFSDATLATYSAGVPSQLGAVARTDGWAVGGRGSLNNVVPWPIFNKLPMSFLTVGRWLNKVGRTSGWTRGQVTHTCVDHADVGGSIMLCQWDSDIWSEPGDSGSPIFLDNDTSQGGGVSAVHLAGLLWGGPYGNWNVTWFSPMDGIDRDFQKTFKVCDPSWNSC